MRRNISAKKFHIDDVKSVQNPVISADIGRWSYCSKIVLAIVYERQINKRQKATKVKSKCAETITKQSIFVVLFFSRRSIWVLLELVCRWTQHFTKIDQEKHKIEQILHLEPHDYPIYYINIDFCHQYGISVAEPQMFLLTKPPQRRGAVRNGCSHKLWCMLLFWRKDILKLSCMALFHMEH